MKHNEKRKWFHELDNKPKRYYRNLFTQSSLLSFIILFPGDEFYKDKYSVRYEERKECK